MVRRVPFPGGRIGPPGVPVFEEPQIRIVIEIDEKGLMKTSINKPLPAVQILGLLLDCMQGQYQAMAQQASLIINPNGKRLPQEEPNAIGEEKEDDNNSRGNPSGGESTIG